MDNSQYCVYCGADVQKDWKFCPECGITIQKKYCSQCDIKMANDWKFCPQCGSSISDEDIENGVLLGHATIPNSQHINTTNDNDFTAYVAPAVDTNAPIYDDEIPF